MADQTDDETEHKITATMHPQLLDILVCPLTHQPLQWDKENNELISQKAKRAYPIRDGIPILVAREARIIK